MPPLPPPILSTAPLLTTTLAAPVTPEPTPKAPFGATGLALLHVDLDRFKQINDTLGHVAGDAMLVHVATLLRESAGEGNFVARVGGDEFVVVCINETNTDRLAALRQDAVRMGIEVLPPDVNRSGADFTLEKREGGKLAIRYALAAVKKVGQAAMQALEAARGERPFADLADFAARVDPRQINRMQLENLAKAGAFDSLDRNRARVFAGAETILRRAQASTEEKTSGQIGLFGGAEPEKLRLPETPPWEPMDALAFEAEAVGFHLTAHPLDAYGQALRRLGVVPSNQLDARAQAGAARVKLAGSFVASKERITRTGSRMAWIRLSDSGGSYEVTVFSEVLGRARELFVPGSSVLVTADIKLEGEALRITAQDVTPLEQAAAQAGAGLRVWLEKTEAVPHIRALLDREGKGRGRVVLIPRLGADRDVEISLPGGFNVTPRLAQALKSLQGVERTEDL